MRLCKSCGFATDGDATECPYCGDVTVVAARAEPRVSAYNDKRIDEKSAFVEYADLMDDDTLYRAAAVKLGGASDDVERREAAELLSALAFRGHCDGMFKLSEYLLSLDPPDEKPAVAWLKIAADAGHVPSKIKLRMLGTKAAVDSPLIISDGDGDFVARVRAVLPSIITICSEFNGKGGKNTCSSGSGFIIEGGYVITNAHVVTAKPKSITARFEPSIDDKAYNLIPLIIDVDCDIAVLRFTGLKNDRVSALTNLSLRAGEPEYGEDVYTVGNPLGLGLSVSRGVISCPCRETDYPRGVTHVVQTDISPNPGNSGGALLDVHNNVVGMITYHPEKAQGGIAMCVPTDYIIDLLNELK